MAVSRATSFAAVTAPYTGAVRVSSIIITRNPSVTTTQFLAVYNAAAPTVGTDAPELCLAIPAITTDKQAPNGQQRMKVVLPNGGYRCQTALSYIVTTTFNGATGSTTNKPLAVEVFYVPGN